eukprot:4909171-Amphidinium_carterae.1
MQVEAQQGTIFSFFTDGLWEIFQQTHAERQLTAKRMLITTNLLLSHNKPPCIDVSGSTKSSHPRANGPVCAPTRIGIPVLLATVCIGLRAAAQKQAAE